MDMSLSKLQEIVKDRGAWHAAVHRVTKRRTRLSDWKTTILGALNPSLYPEGSCEVQTKRPRETGVILLPDLKHTRGPQSGPALALAVFLTAVESKNKIRFPPLVSRELRGSVYGCRHPGPIAALEAWCCGHWTIKEVPMMTFWKRRTSILSFGFCFFLKDSWKAGILSKTLHRSKSTEAGRSRAVGHSVIQWAGQWEQKDGRPGTQGQISALNSSFPTLRSSKRWFHEMSAGYKKNQNQNAENHWIPFEMFLQAFYLLTCSLILQGKVGNRGRERWAQRDKPFPKLSWL